MKKFIIILFAGLIINGSANAWSFMDAFRGELEIYTSGESSRADFKASIEALTRDLNNRIKRTQQEVRDGVSGASGNLYSIYSDLYEGNTVGAASAWTNSLRTAYTLPRSPIGDID